MINKFLLPFILFIFANISWACEIHLPENILILSQKADLTKIIVSTECQPNVISEVNETLLNSDGKVSHFQLSELLKNKNMTVTFKPSLIQIQHLKVQDMFEAILK